MLTLLWASDAKLQWHIQCDSNVCIGKLGKVLGRKFWYLEGNLGSWKEIMFVVHEDTWEITLVSQK